MNMKELSIEQKAEAYDKALKLLKECTPDENGFITIYSQEIFPELKESDDERDERVRKALLEMVHDTPNNLVWADYGIRKKDAIAWLEKQTSNVDNANKEYWRGYREGKQEILDKYAELEKHGDKKSIWHNEDEEPKRDSLILLIMQSGTPIVAKIIEPNHTFNHGERWAYIDDLLEKQGEYQKFRDSIQVGDRVTRNEDGVLVNLSQLNRVAKREEPHSNQLTAEMGDILNEYIDMQNNAKDPCECCDHKAKNCHNFPCDRKKAFDAQKPDNKVEPKFKVGNWYQCTKDFFGKGVTFDKNTAYYCAKEGCLQNEYGCHIAIVKDLYDNFKLWTIQDAKAGDVLFYRGNVKYSDGIKYERICLFNNLDNAFFTLTKNSNYVEEYDINVNVDYLDNTVPATKEQREILFMAMADARYTFDFEKKELKPTELPKGEDYGIDGLWHAHRILEKTLGKVEGYQTDDGILEHECAINTIKELYEHKPTWSEEDERMITSIMGHLERQKNYQMNTTNIEQCQDWLESLKNMVQPQPKQEWSEEDKKLLNDAISLADECDDI